MGVLIHKTFLFSVLYSLSLGSVVFDFTFFKGCPGSWNTIVNYTQIQIGETEAFNRTIHYLYGEYSYYDVLNDSYQILLQLRVRNRKTGRYVKIPELPPYTVYTISEFLETVSVKYLLPLAKNRTNLFPDGNRLGPLQEGEYYLNKPNSAQDLCAESLLEPNRYQMYAEYYYYPEGTMVGCADATFEVYTCDEIY